MPIKIVCKDIVNSDTVVMGKAWSLSQICQMILLCVHGLETTLRGHDPQLTFTQQDCQMTRPLNPEMFPLAVQMGTWLNWYSTNPFPMRKCHWKHIFVKWGSSELTNTLSKSIFISCAVKHWWERDFIDSVLSGTQQYMFDICLHIPTGRPGVLWFMGSQSQKRLSDWTELNW